MNKDKKLGLDLGGITGSLTLYERKPQVKVLEGLEVFLINFGCKF